MSVQRVIYHSIRMRQSESTIWVHVLDESTGKILPLPSWCSEQETWTAYINRALLAWHRKVQKGRQ